MKLIILLLSLTLTTAQNPSDPTSPASVDNFQPSLAVVIGMLAVMFSLTFVLLLYAKFCHRAASFTSNANSRQIHDGLPRSRSLASSGVDKTVVESLPFFRFSSLRGSRDGLECAVCLARFDDVDVLRLLPKCKHAFHIDCIDQWLDKHSTCPLCRRNVTADDLSHLPLSTSLRFLSNPPPELERQESNLDLYVEREESRRHGSSRFRIGGSFRKEEEEEIPIPESMDLESPPSPPAAAALHRFNHKIVVSEAVLKNRWSNVSSSDIMFLRSEILMNDDDAEEEETRVSSVEERKTAEEETVIMSIREEMERKRAFEGKVREINKELNFPATSSGANRVKLGFESRSIDPNDKRSMSEIVAHPRFQDLGNEDSRVEENDVKDERTRRLWIPIARKTVQWFANRERIAPQSQESRLNI